LENDFPLRGKYKNLFEMMENMIEMGQGPPNTPTFLSIDSCSETLEEQ
jgi:hypothetical protein